MKKVYKLTATVTDAGDPVAGASVSVHGLHKTTGTAGTVKFKFGPKVKGTFTVGITRPGYWRLTKTAGF